MKLYRWPRVCWYELNSMSMLSSTFRLSRIIEKKHFLWLKAMAEKRGVRHLIRISLHLAVQTRLCLFAQVHPALFLVPHLHYCHWYTCWNSKC